MADDNPTPLTPKRRGASLNKITLIGMTGRAAELRMTKEGRPVTHFSVATYRYAGEHRTDWHRITASSGLATWCHEWVKVGLRVHIEGMLLYDSYELDGVNIPSAEILATDVEILDKDNRVIRGYSVGDGSLTWDPIVSEWEELEPEDGGA